MGYHRSLGLRTGFSGIDGKESSFARVAKAFSFFFQCYPYPSVYTLTSRTELIMERKQNHRVKPAPISYVHFHSEVKESMGNPNYYVS